MTTEIRNAALYFDRTVQLAHRTGMGDDAHAIDVDLAGFCKRCSRPLYLIESTTNPEKGTRYLRALASAASCHAVLILHREGTIRRWRRIAPTWSDWAEGEPWAYLTALRARHEMQCKL